MVSKKSVSMTANTANSSAGVKICSDRHRAADLTVWNGAQNVLKSGALTTAFGSSVTPRSSAATAATRMPHRMSPFTLSAMNARIANRPMRVTHTYLVVKSPRPTTVAAVRRDDAALDQADDRDEQADADADRALQVERDGVHDRLACTGEYERPR